MLRLLANVGGRLLGLLALPLLLLLIVAAVVGGMLSTSLKADLVDEASRLEDDAILYANVLAWTDRMPERSAAAAALESIQRREWRDGLTRSSLSSSTFALLFDWPSGASFTSSQDPISLSFSSVFSNELSR